MQGTGIHHIELIILALLVIVAGLATLARRFQIPYPIILVIGGLILSLIPGLPRLALRPDVFFLVFLPPLLYVGAFNTSWRDFRANITSISLLAFGLVGFTVLGVSLGAGWLLPGFDYRAGAVLGAAVSTTDAIASTAISRRVGLPRRISDVIDGESLVNDASGLLALQFTVALMVSGSTPTPGGAILQLLWLVCGGIVVGLVAAYLIHKVSFYITDAPIEITFSLVTPYIAYLSAEGIGASGVLAAVACGLYLGRKNSETLSINARLDSSAVWRTIDFILNGFVFVMIGLQLPFILRQIRGRSMGELFLDAGIFVAFIIALRLVWVYASAWMVHWIRTRVFRKKSQAPPARELFVVGWTGMRGVLALAAAISLPQAIGDGTPFPQRSIIIFLTFSVIFVTLVLQGLTLPALIRKLGLVGLGRADLEEQEARREILNRVLGHVRSLKSKAKPEHMAVYDDLARRYRGRLALVESGDEEHDPLELSSERYYRRLSRQIYAMERDIAMQLRNENKINDEVLRMLERELDLAEARFARS